MNIKSILLLAFSFLMLSCGSASTTSQTNVNPHAATHMKMHEDHIKNEKQKEMTKTVENNKSSGLQQNLLKKWEQGIDFYAFGNEPFWSLDMDFEKVIQFKNLDGLEFNAPAVDPIKAMDADVSRYRSITESGEIIVQLNHTKCIDNMSGEKFNYTVKIDYKTSTDLDYSTYNGCGSYVPDPRLHDIWAITELDGININPQDFKNKAPYFELNIREETIIGTNGCNSFRGSIEIQKGKIIFSHLAITLMACMDNTEISNKIGKTLSGKKLAYTIENNHLVLFNNDKKVMTLKHID